MSRCAQASLETTVALSCSLLLLFGSFKVFVWLNERLITRQQYYASTRSVAGQSATKIWVDPTRAPTRSVKNGRLEAAGPLEIFK